MSRRELGWHPTDPLSLVGGLLALGLAVLVLLDVDLDGRLVLPSLLLLAGAAGVVAAVRRSGGARTEE